MRSSCGRSLLALGALGLAVALSLTAPGCSRKRRYDGTCETDQHCLDFQRCNSGICVRREAILKEKNVAAAPTSGGAKPTRKPTTPALVPSVAPPPEQKATGPAKKAPPPSLPGTRKRGFRLDA